MAQSTQTNPTSNVSIRTTLAVGVEQAQEALARLQAEYERFVVDPDVIEEDRTTARFLAERARNALGTAEDALGRFDSGTYGVCTMCEAPIPPDRLEAIPSTKTCRNCS